MPPRIGVFDSGVGGLGVWRWIVRALPGVPTTYLADQAHAPYGDRTYEEIRTRAERAVELLLSDGAGMVVVACNTASAAALAHLRSAWPGIPFVGMEPAVKPAALASRSGVIGVLATAATLGAPGFRALIRRHAGAVRVVTGAGRGLVEAVEAGELTGPRLEALVERCVAPIRGAGADQIVLGCTHYPFLVQPIGRVAGAGVNIVDPAPAVARRTAEVWLGVVAEAGGPSPVARRPGGDHRMLTTGDPARLEASTHLLVPDLAAGLAVRRVA